MSDIESELDALIQQKDLRKACRIARLRIDIEKDHGSTIADKLTSVVDDSAYPVSRVVEIMRSHGYPLGKDALGRHRKRGGQGGCDCK